MRRGILAWAFLAVAVGLGCEDDPTTFVLGDTSSPTECVPSTARLCGCDGGQRGAQECGPDGAWRPCQCVAPDGGPDAADTADAPDPVDTADAPDPVDTAPDLPPDVPADLPAETVTPDTGPDAPPPAAAPEVTPPSFAFTQATPSKPQSQGFEVGNAPGVGQLPFSVVSVTFSPPSSELLLVGLPALPAVVLPAGDPAYEALSFTVTYTPKDASPDQVDLVVTTDASPSPLVVPLTGAPAVGTWSVAYELPAALDFSGVTSPECRSAVVTSEGPGPLVVQEPTLAPAAAAAVFSYACFLPATTPGGADQPIDGVAASWPVALAAGKAVRCEVCYDPGAGPGGGGTLSIPVATPEPATIALALVADPTGPCAACDATYPACAEVSGTFYCVQCATDADCPGSCGCDEASFTCEGGCVAPAACASDADCDAGITGFDLKCDATSGLCYDTKGGCDDVTAFCKEGNPCLGALEAFGVPGDVPGLGFGGLTLSGLCECNPFQEQLNAGDPAKLVCEAALCIDLASLLQLLGGGASNPGIGGSFCFDLDL